MNLSTDDNFRAALFRTLAYSEIFSYNPTLSETYTWLIGPLAKIPTYHQLTSFVSTSPQIIFQKKRLGFKSQPNFINQSQQRHQYFHLKKNKIQPLIRFFALIPTIKLIAITGSVAAMSPAEDDDIDLLIVAQSGSLWITRFVTIFLTEILHLRRRPNSHNNNNKICLNLFLDQNSLALPQSRQDLYTARELLQIIPLLNRDHTYEILISQNRWALEFFPVSWSTTFNWINQFNQTNSIFPQFKFSFLEKIFWRLQANYMAHRRSVEKVTNNSAFFHPFDYRHYAMTAYNHKLNLYNKIYCEKSPPKNRKFTSLRREKKDS